MPDYQTKKLDLTDASEKQAWHALLGASRLHAESSFDVAFGVYDGARLIAAGARFRNILKMIAVAAPYRGGEAFNALLDALLKDAFKHRYTKLFAYTKPESADAFASLGFRRLVTYNHALTFLERGHPSLDDYLSFLSSKKVAAATAGAVVMHANPFTNGHLHLIETALTVCDAVYVFVLSEDRGLFTPDVRLELAERGVRRLNRAGKQVIVVPTRDYLVSTQTFPAYFAADARDAARLQAGIDATLFKEAIAPALDVSYRFVGEEPRSEVTRLYNEILQDVLDEHPQLCVIPRLTRDGTVISASMVRALWQKDDLAAAKPLVPTSTFDYLAANRPLTELT